MESVRDVDTLDGMRYADLQKLAKTLGIRANMKADKLLNSLKEHYANQQKTVATTEVKTPAAPTIQESTSTEESTDQSSDESTQVTKRRRGRGKKGRKGKEARNEDEQEPVKKMFPTPKVPTPRINTPKTKMTPLRRSVLTPKLFSPHTGTKSSIPKATTPKIATPKVATPKIATPKVATPKIDTPKVATPKIATPKVATPKLATPKTKSPAAIKRKTPKLRTPVVPSGGKKVSPASRRGTPGSQNKPGKRQRSASPDQSGSAKRPRRSSRTPTSAHKPAESGGERRRTFELEEPTSPGVKVLLESMQEDMTSAEMKDSLLEVIHRNVQEKKKMTAAEPGSHIPRFAAFVMKKKAEEEKARKTAITPGNKDWAKIHERQFRKMDGLDTYLEKKHKRAESVTASVKKARLVAEQTRSAIEILNKCRTPPVNGSKSVTKVGARSGFKAPHAGVPFVPKVTSTSKMNLNFASFKTPSNDSSLPARTPRAVTIVEPQPSSASKENRKRKSLQSTSEKRKSLQSTSEKRISGVTPYKFTSQQDVELNKSVNSVKKAKFDLKASLSKSISWKPHRGKLEDFKMDNVYRKDVKAVKVTSKEDRRRMAHQHRADKRLDTQMKRRGINL